MSRRRASATPLLLVLAVVACRDGSEVTGPAPESPAPVMAQAQAPTLEELAERIPGFGGFYLDGGRPTVFLTDITGRGAAVQALTPFIRGLGQNPADLQVRHADYDYRQLTLWFNAAGPLALDIDGAFMVDLDEARNRVLVGVENRAAAAAVRAVLLRAGLPERSLLIEEREPIRQVVSLQARASSIVGGVQINFPGYLCTLGFNAVVGGQNSFITNSHCTTKQGGVESTPYYQPLQSTYPTAIGIEVQDPAYQKGLPGCPKSKLCRYSDASRALYSAGTSFTLGRIATPGAGSLDYATSWTISGTGTPTFGETLNKVGRTTGWTAGAVTNTCVHTGVLGTRYAQLCQFFVAAGVDGGDSGSPVFRLSGGNAILIGLLWGSGGGSFVASPLSQIQSELGGTWQVR